MIIAVHVGMRGDADGSVAWLLSEQNQSLIDAGWTVPSEMPAGDPETDIGRIFCAWREWIDTAQAGGAEQIAISDPRFTEGHFVRGEVGRFVDGLRRQGSLRGVGVTRRLDDHIVASYTQQLREGRTARMGRRERTGSGSLYNYFPRLQRWISALGHAFTVVYCPTSAHPDDVLPAVAAPLGLPAPPSSRPVPSLLTPTAAQAMRLINRRLQQAVGLPDHSVHEIREAAFDHLADISLGEEPLRMPPRAAAAILDRYRSAAHTLTRAMSPSDAERFMSDELPPAVPLDVPGSAHLANEVLSRLGVEGATTDQSTTKAPRTRLRLAAAKARRAIASSNDDAYRVAVRRLQRTFSEMPSYRERIPEPGGTSRIPNRLVQYWDPWPPPDEMRPWLQSWSDIGVRHGSHRVVSFDEAAERLSEAAGERGLEAFRRAPHPAARSDLYRYAELYLHGGWYVDAEHEALLPIADVHPWPVDHVFVVRPTGDRVPNGFIGAVPGSRLIRAALDEACANVLERPGLGILELTGPEMFSRHVLPYLDESDASYVLLPTTAVFQVLQVVHNEAAYKAGGHWRDHERTD